MKGFGTLVSGNIGKLMATLEPRLLRIFAVNVLGEGQLSVVAHSYGCSKRTDINYSREPNMLIRDFLWEEETVARDSTGRVKIWLSEDTLDAKSWEGSDRHQPLIWLHVLSSKSASAVGN